MSNSTVQSVFVFFVVLCMAHGSIAQDIGIPSVSAEDDNVIDLLANRLTAWQPEDGGPVDNWRAAGKVLTNFRAGSHLISKQKFEDFDLSLEFMLPRGGNSGVYLRGRYEVQLYDSRRLDPKKSTGAIWGQIPIETQMYNGPNRWNQLAVRIVDDRVTVLVNRKPVIRSARLKGPTRGAIDQNDSGPGPILLQSLHGVRFRKILIKEL